MQVIADLHIHSRFSRAVSPQMTLIGISQWALKKGIDLVATGDWTHPLWFREIEEQLEEDGAGFLKFRTGDSPVRFLLSTEISCIFSQGGRARRIHTLVWVPSLSSARSIGQALTKQGCNLLSDGRPIIGLSLIQLSDTVLSIEPNALIVPAHIWTPWFSVFGKMGGFDSLDEAFGPFAKSIYAVETGLSSSPDMNWRIPELDTRAIVSFSDAHSGPKLGRELTIFSLPELRYANLLDALKQPSRPDKSSSQSSISFTVEFYPEEGKYHYTGHRDCNVRLTPAEARSKGTGCPVCGRPLTQGVMQRVEELSGRNEDSLGIVKDTTGSVLRLKSISQRNATDFVMLVPLQEIIAESIGSPITSVKTQRIYDTLVQHFGNEFRILLEAAPREIASVGTPQIAHGVIKARTGDIVIDPGYDGVFGVVKIWKSKEEWELIDRSKEQLGLF